MTWIGIKQLSGIKYVNGQNAEYSLKCRKKNTGHTIVYCGIKDVNGQNVEWSITFN